MQAWKAPTSTDEEEKVGLPGLGDVLRLGVVDVELADVAVGVRGPQLREGHVERVAAGVSAHAATVVVLRVQHGHFRVLVFKEDLGATQPGAFQVNTNGRGQSLVHKAGEDHRVPRVSR